VARYRVEHDVADDIPGLGPEPDYPRTRSAWRQAGNTVRQLQQRLGFSIDRDRRHDCGAGIER
jgi:hypothetical protein